MCNEMLLDEKLLQFQLLEARSQETLSAHGTTARGGKHERRCYTDHAAKAIIDSVRNGTSACRCSFRMTRLQSPRSKAESRNFEELGLTHT